MKAADAPPAGWYPDPENRQRLRWWLGDDWADQWRSPPLRSWDAPPPTFDDESLDPKSETAAGERRKLPKAGSTRTETEEVLKEVRSIARSEVDRAADIFTQRASDVRREIQPLITDYTNRIIRWARIGMAALIVLGLAWIAFQLFAQVTLFEWVGDRIDNLSD